MAGGRERTKAAENRWGARGDGMDGGVARGEMVVVVVVVVVVVKQQQQQS
jgi:hypothetical protein